MAYQFDHLTNPQNTESGIAEFALLAPQRWFAAGGIKKPGTGTAAGDEVRILLTHEFLPEKGFIRFALAPEKNQYSAETIGDKGFTKFRNTIEIFVPGSYQEVHEAMKWLKTEPMIVLVKDSNCDANLYYQIGDACLGAWISGSFTTSTSAEGVKGYTITITNTAKSVVLYQGAITMNSPYLPASPSLTLSEVTSSSMRATWGAVTGATSYILQRDTDPNFANPVQVYAGALLTYVNTGLTQTKKYWYRVIAVATGYNNGYPKAASATTLATPVMDVLTMNVLHDAPGFTSFVRLTSTANETVKLKWGAAIPEIDVVLTANTEELVFHTYAAAGADVMTLKHGPGSTLNKIDAAGCNITTITGTMPAALATLDLSNNNKITALPALPATLVNIDLYGSDMSVATVSALLQALDTAGAIGGTAGLQMAPAAIPNTAGQTAKTNLEAKGWTVLVNA
jgi:hypothetical protein